MVAASFKVQQEIEENENREEKDAHAQISPLWGIDRENNNNSTKNHRGFSIF